MKPQELIEILQTMPKDRDIFWPHFEEGYCKVTGAHIADEEATGLDEDMKGDIILESEP